jgi:hypothetical protein
LELVASWVILVLQVMLLLFLEVFSHLLVCLYCNLLISLHHHPNKQESSAKGSVRVFSLQNLQEEEKLLVECLGRFFIPFSLDSYPKK